MGSLSMNALILSIGVTFDAQLKAADNLFFSAAVDFTDATRPQFGGAVGKASGADARLYTAAPNNATAYSSPNNPVSGDPVTVRQISTAEGPRYQITDGSGREIKAETQASGGNYRNIPRYMVKSDGIVYDMLTTDTPTGGGTYRVCDPAQPEGGIGLPGDPGANNINITHYARPVGRITFKAKEGATLARAQDDLQRVGSIIQLLTRLLESVQDEAKGFSSLIR